MIGEFVVFDNDSTDDRRVNLGEDGDYPIYDRL